MVLTERITMMAENASEEKVTEMTKEKFDQLTDLIGLDCLITKPIVIEEDDKLTEELNLLTKAIKRFEENTNYKVSVTVKGR